MQYANFLGSTISIHKQNYQLPGIHETTWCKTMGYSLLRHNPLAHLNFAVISVCLYIYTNLNA